MFFFDKGGLIVFITTLTRYTQSCWQSQQLKKLCWRFEETVVEGKQRAEGKRGNRKRLRVTAEEMEVQVEEMWRGIGRKAAGSS